MLKCITGTKKNSKELVASAPNLRPLDPKNSSHVEAGIRYQDYLLGIMVNPLFLGQQIPDVVLDTPNPNLTTLTEEEISYINGTVDAWAFDLYVAQFVYPLEGGIKACEANSSHPLWPTCVAAASTQENGWLVREQFGYVWNTYCPSSIMVTEFGFPQIDDSEHNLLVQQYDFERSMYYQNFLTETLHAIHSDGVNVIGVLA
ncbi:hypothetical protein ACMFMG_002715 [Clarireedia jacksonii]